MSARPSLARKAWVGYSRVMPSPIEIVRAYHERTKHRPERYARALGYLDWSTQPDPFRSYEGAKVLPLDEVPPTPAPAWDALFSDPPAAAPLDRRSISQFLYDSLALSAWKEAGSNRWALRVNPSSGNLHPTEAHLLLPAIEGLSDAPALAHYSPKLHALEARAELAEVAAGSFFVGLTSIHVRESWKYGERAYRYCQHDVGHAIGAIAIAAAALGWQVRVVEVASADLARLLGISDQVGPEAEHADVLLVVSAQGAAEGVSRLPTLASAIVGVPNRLAEEHQPWPIIDDVSVAAARVESAKRTASLPNEADRLGTRGVGARGIVRQRRSAVAMDAITRLSSADFFRMLARTMPTAGHPIFSALSWAPAIHLALFVHRVDDVEPGLYVLVRNEDDAADLRARIRPDFGWDRVAGAPEGLPLFRLAAAEAQAAAKGVSCGQDIAADGAFAVGMIASFAPRLEGEGASMYPRLFWETGAIGQQLYLEAEAAGVRATGIGCFFDDAMHEVLGFGDERFQSLYHFTVGGPVEDSRLRTLAAYPGRGGG